jgi:uncharacterized protein
VGRVRASTDRRRRIRPGPVVASWPSPCPRGEPNERGDVRPVGQGSTKARLRKLRLDEQGRSAAGPTLLHSEPSHMKRALMTPREWLLLFLSADALGVDGPEELDPIRIQKGMFLLSERGPARHTYSFRPYNWGPFSSAIYSDLESLESSGLVESHPLPGRTWKVYQTTTAGEDRAARLAKELDADDVNWLGRTRQYVTGRSFVRLLRDIYANYPQYKRRSLLR